MQQRQQDCPLGWSSDPEVLKQPEVQWCFDEAGPSDEAEPVHRSQGLLLGFPPVDCRSWSWSVEKVSGLENRR